MSVKAYLDHYVPVSPLKIKVMNRSIWSHLTLFRLWQILECPGAPATTTCSITPALMLMTKSRYQHGKQRYMKRANSGQVKCQSVPMVCQMSNTRSFNCRAVALVIVTKFTKKWNHPWRIWWQNNCGLWSKRGWTIYFAIHLITDKAASNQSAKIYCSGNVAPAPWSPQCR